jgi:phosphoglycerate kinase
MLENVRFHPREEKNCRMLAKQWSKLADLYINDAFAVSHRTSSSIVAIAEYLPAYAGLLLESEVSHLSKVLESKIRPKIAIIGGAKLETKVKVIKNLLKKMDYVLLGGAIANNFLKARGMEVGKSLVDDALLGAAQKMLSKKLLIPIDVVVTTEISRTAKSAVKSVNQVGKSDIILDIGPKTVQEFSKVIKQSKLIVWNGPLGYFEIYKYKKASVQITKVIGQSKAESIIGGGETVQLLRGLKIVGRKSYLSTGGGAMLEFLEGKLLPGIKPLIDKH